MISEDNEYLTAAHDPGLGGVIPEVKERARWLEVRRRIENRQELMRLRELLDDPEFQDVD